MSGQRKFTFPILILVLAISSCTKLSLLSPPVESEQEIEVKSLPMGGIINPGEAVRYVLHVPDGDQDALNLEINLTTPAGETVWNNKITAPAPNEELELTLPGLASGQYTLEFVLNRGSGTTVEKRIDFFYSKGEFSILGITSYPPTLLPGSQSRLTADLIIPPGADPYIRWTQDEIVLAKGLVSQGLGQVNWAAPTDEGVYAIQVELFPQAPPSGRDYSFTSTVSLSARLFVSSKETLSENDLRPAESYYSLFHFNGSLRDAGTGGSSGTYPIDNSGAQLELMGNPSFVSQGDHFGYRLEPSSGLRYPGFILPVKNGRLRPFTLNLALVLNNTSTGRNILDTRQGNQQPGFRLYLDHQGQPLAVMTANGGEVTIPSGISHLPLGAEQHLSLSIIPSESSLHALWFHNGLPTTSLNRQMTLSGLNGSGEAFTLIGGENGFSGIISELGVYYRDGQQREAIDPSIYTRAMERKHGSGLILAEGFDGLHLPDGFVLKPEGQYRSGAALVGASSSLTLPPFETNGQGTTIELALAGLLPAEGHIAFFREGGSGSSGPEPYPFLEIHQNGLIQMGRETKRLPAIMGSDPVIRVILGRSGVTVLTPGGRFESGRRSGDSAAAWVTVRLSNNRAIPTSAEGGILALERVAIFNQGH